MDDIRRRLDRDLQTAVARLHQLHPPGPDPEPPGAIADNTPFADEVDGIQVTESREIARAVQRG